VLGWAARERRSLAIIRNVECRWEEAMQDTLLKEVATRTWVTPAYCDVRLGFEVTAYVYVR
jgi:pyrroloquinoline quinone biosynthesis protein A